MDPRLQKCLADFIVGGIWRNHYNKINAILSFSFCLCHLPVAGIAPVRLKSQRLSLLFVFVGSTIFGQQKVLGFTTLLIAHITFNLPYVILSVMPKLGQMDPSLSDAAQDLGCTPVQAFSRSSSTR